eukprot:g377.t1 g377   contig1:914365-915730(+)
MMYSIASIQRKHIKVLAVGCIVLFLMTLIDLDLADVVNGNGDALIDPTSRSLQSTHNINISNKADSTSYNGEEDPTKYAYLIINYHKTGHQLSSILARQIQATILPSSPTNSNGSFQFTYSSAPDPRRTFNTQTKCSDISFLKAGTVTTMGAPEFHCDAKVLMEMLLNNPAEEGEKLGVKIVHLIRNPFAMMVSNYHYHSQDPTPEPFVHTKNPCVQNPIGPYELNDLLLPALSGSSSLSQTTPIVTEEDFTNISTDCTSLYQTNRSLRNASFYQHLQQLDPKDGIRLSSADKFGHVARMANDVVKFREVDALMLQRRQQQRGDNENGIQKKIQVMSFTMDDFISQPTESMLGFLDFVFPEDTVLTQQMKQERASKYHQGYERKKQTSDHFTNGKVGDTDMLIEYLRGDEVFGGPLGRIEKLLTDEI